MRAPQLFVGRRDSYSDGVTGNAVFILQNPLTQHLLSSDSRTILPSPGDTVQLCRVTG